MTKTNTTERVYAFIKAYWQAHRLSPSQQEIADNCFISKSAVARHLDRLEGEGKIERVPFIPRSISLVAKNENNE